MPGLIRLRAAPRREAPPAETPRSSPRGAGVPGTLRPLPGASTYPADHGEQLPSRGRARWGGNCSTNIASALELLPQLWGWRQSWPPKPGGPQNPLSMSPALPAGHPPRQTAGEGGKGLGAAGSHGFLRTRIAKKQERSKPSPRNKRRRPRVPPRHVAYKSGWSEGL